MAVSPSQWDVAGTHFDRQGSEPDARGIQQAIRWVSLTQFAYQLNPGTAFCTPGTTEEIDVLNGA
jgi:hypothetical protein